LDIEEYKTTREYRGFHTTVDVIFIDTPFPISDCQQKNIDNFYLKQDSFTNDILNKVFDFYKASYAVYKEGWTYGNKLSEEEIEKYLPTPTTPEKLKEHFTPQTIYIADKNKCKDGFIGISFDCTWDINSGLGLLIKDWKVVAVSVSEISFIYF
jgi:hypothetical protein